MKSEIQEKLHQLALKRSTPFCYSCYKVAPAGCCSSCGSDDLMRIVEGVGCEYGTDWVIKHILSEELTPVDTDEVFEESLRQCYPEETTVGWMTFDTVELMKSQDPVFWEMARNEYINSLEQDKEIISFDDGSKYYWVTGLESLIYE
jgi:hypothetical protein